MTLTSPDHNINRDVAFEVTRGVHILESAPAVASAPQARPVVKVPTVKVLDGSAAPQQHPGVVVLAENPDTVSIGSVRLASLDGRVSELSGLKPLNATFKVVAPTAESRSGLGPRLARCAFRR